MSTTYLNTVKNVTVAEAQQLVTSSTITRTAAAGAKFASRANIALTAAGVIVTALTWFYQQAQDAATATGTDMDYWGAKLPIEIMSVNIQSGFAGYVSNVEQRSYTIAYGWKTTPRNGASASTNGGTKPAGQAASFAAQGKTLAENELRAKWSGGYPPAFAWQQGVDNGNTYTVKALVVYGSIMDWIKSAPAAINAVPGAWSKFANDYATRPSWATTPTQIPGAEATYDGGINQNQWTDTLRDPNLDTDGDGWEDDAELQLNHLPIVPWTPYQPPPPQIDPNYDSDNDGYSDKKEDEADTPLNDPSQHPPGKPDRPLEPWEQDPRLEDPPPAESPESDIDGDGESNQIDQDDDGDGIQDSEDEQPYTPYVPPPVVDPTPGDGVNPTPGDSDGDGIQDSEDDYVTPTEDPTPGDNIWPSPGDADGDGQPDVDPNPVVDPTPGDGVNPTPGDSDGDGIQDSEDDYVTPTEDPTPGDNIWPSPGDTDGDGQPDVTPTPREDPTPGDNITPTPGDEDGDGVPDPQDPYVTPPDPTPGDGIVPTPGDGNGDGVPDAPGDDTGPTPVDEPGEDTGPDPEQQPPPEEPGQEPSPMDPGAQEPRYPLQLPIPTLTFPTEPFIQWQDRMQTKIVQVIGQAQTKFPFGLGTWIPVIPGTGGLASCAPITMTLLGTQQDVGICNTPIDTFMSSAGRAALLLLACVAFYFASAKVMAAS